MPDLPSTDFPPSPGNRPSPILETASSKADGDIGRPGMAQIDDDEGEIALVLNILWRRKVLITVVSLLVGMAAVVVILNLSPRYEAWSAILLDTRPTKLVDIPAATVRQLLGGPQADVGVVNSEMVILRSPGLAERVVQRLDLLENSEFWEKTGFWEKTESVDGPQRESASWLQDSFTRVSVVVRGWIETVSAATAGKEPTAKRSEMDTAVDHLLRHLSVSSDPRSYIIRVGYYSRDPALAATITDALVETYLGLQLNEKRDAVRRANIWLNERVAELRERINKTEGATERFKEASGLSEVRGMTVNAQQLSEINSQLMLAASERAQKEAELRSVEVLQAGNGTDAAARAVTSRVVEALREQETSLVRLHTELESRLGPSHPQMIDVEAQLVKIRNRIEDEVAGKIKALRSEVRAVQAREAALRQHLAQLQQIDSGMSEKRVRLRELEREVEANRLLFANLLNRSKEIENEGEIQQPDARIVAKARVPTEPAFPQKKLLLLLTLIGSGLFGLTVAFACEFFDRAFRSTRQLERLTQRPCVGLTPHFNRSAAADEMTLRHDSSAYVDAIRSIRVALRRSNCGQDPKIVLITSAVPREGKSVFALSLARSAAQAGYRSLLIDCDLRNPSVCRLLKQPHGVDLVSFCQAGDRRDVALADDVAQTDPESGMRFISTAGYTHGPQDLFSSRATREFLDRMRLEYDLIVLDTSPVLAATDALILAHLADATLFLVRWGATPRAVVIDALRMLAREGVGLAGTVLSRVNLRRYRLYGHAERGYFFANYATYNGARRRA